MVIKEYKDFPLDLKIVIRIYQSIYISTEDNISLRNIVKDEEIIQNFRKLTEYYYSLFDLSTEEKEDRELIIKKLTQKTGGIRKIVVSESLKKTTEGYRRFESILLYTPTESYYSPGIKLSVNCLVNLRHQIELGLKGIDYKFQGGHSGHPNTTLASGNIVNVISRTLNYFGLYKPIEEFDISQVNAPTREFWRLEIEKEEDRIITTIDKENLVKAAKILGFNIELKNERIILDENRITVRELIQAIRKELEAINLIPMIPAPGISTITPEQKKKIEKELGKIKKKLG